MSASMMVCLRRWLNRSNDSEKAIRRLPLGVEQLEDRSLPAVTLNQAFLATLYQGELGRDIESSGLSYWNNQLVQTGSRVQVAGAILDSNEFLAREVTTDYQSLLGRAPDPSGLQTFVGALQTGTTPQQVQALLMGSDEFFAHVGGDPNHFLNAVYGAVLSRTVDAAGLLAWSPQAVDTAGRTAVVQQIEASPEASQLMVATIYADTLGRAPDAAGLSAWASQLEQGVSEATVLANVLGSNEFAGRLQSYLTQITTSDPNIAAAGFIAADHLFASQPRIVPAGQPPTTPPPDNSPDPPTGNVGDNSGFDSGSSGGIVIVTTGTDTTGGTPDTSGSTPDCATSPPDNSCTDAGCDTTIPDSSGDCSNDTPPVDNSGCGSTDCGLSD